MEEAPRGGHGEKRAHGRGAGGFAENGDVAGVATERGDVVANPRKGGDLVALARVRDEAAARQDVAQEEIAEGAETVIDRDDHDVAARGEWPAVVEGLVAGPVRETAAVNPEEHRAAGAIRGGAKDVQVEAVLVLGAARGEAGDGVGCLRCREADRISIADARPRGGRFGSAPAKGAGGRCGVGDAQECEVALALDAAQGAIGGLDDGHAGLLEERWRDSTPGCESHGNG